MTRIRYWLGWIPVLWHRRFPGRWTEEEVTRIRAAAAVDAAELRNLAD